MATAIRDRQELVVRWSDAIDIADVLGDSELPEAIRHHDARADLYMISWTRRLLWREHKLCYIGLAFRQSPTDRLGNHHRLPLILSEVAPGWRATVRFGTLELPPGQRRSAQRVQHVEAALIYAHQPVYNQKCRASYRGRDLVVHNRGARRPLQRRVIAAAA